mgnify:CR=1 FL=1
MHRQRTSASQRCTIFRVLCFISFSSFLLHIVICYLLAAGSAPLNERDPSVQLPIVSRYPHKDGGGRNAAGDPGPWTGTAAGADQTDPYSLIEKFRSLYHRFCRLLDASASPRFLLRSACSDQGSGFVWTAPPFIKNNRQVTGCTRKPYPSRHPMGSAGIFLIFVSPVLSWSDRQDIPFPRERKQRKIRLRIYFWGSLCLLCHT